MIYPKFFILSAIDNLLKGQTGQAIQNLNIMSGFSMDDGLDLTNNFTKNYFLSKTQHERLSEVKFYAQAFVSSWKVIQYYHHL